MMRILLTFLLFILSFSQSNWQYLNYNNINIPPKSPVALQGYNFFTSATEIFWNINSTIQFDCYLLDSTNLNLLKNGNSFYSVSYSLNQSSWIGGFSNTTYISNTLIITGEDSTYLEGDSVRQSWN